MTELIIAHIEIPVNDLDASKQFYNNLFGWEFKPFGNGYYLFRGKGLSAGLRKADRILTGDTTIFHIRVDDIETILNKGKELGADVLRGKTIIPVMGWYALLKDINGNTIGLFQSP